ncbi:MAG: diacylglycerol kinase family lipid kinase [Verrucomicrobiota bacterium]|nr:diacylglycerol kinase family lipid kinase [Verrucomicrobiota bacterium]
MRICVIFNPTAKGEKAERLRKHLESVASECSLKLTTGMGAARQLAAEGVRQGYEVIVAAGGDGTLNEVLNGMGDVPGGYEKCKLGVLPIGTVNVFAREMGIPFSILKAWKIIKAGHFRLLDLPIVEYEAEGKQVQRRFIQMAGFGLDARAASMVDWGLKKTVGPIAYLVAGLQAINHLKPKVDVSDGKMKASGDLVIVGNGRYYGGSFALCPQADYTDGILDVSVVEEISWQKMPQHFYNFVSGKMFKPGGTTYFQAKEVTVTSDIPVLFHVEGEIAGQGPARIWIGKSKLRAIVPAGPGCSITE